MSTHIINNKAEYLDVFSGPPSDRQIRAEALRCALDTRKFEIDLYWKRTTYFWTLITAAFAGYFALASSQKPHPGLAFLVSCIGFMLSTGWYLVNRGSKFWQENWERHVSILEDESMGPLYNTTPNEAGFHLVKLWAGYPYSVSKVNQLISLFITMVWMGLIISEFPPCSAHISVDKYWVLTIFTAVFTIVTLVLGRTSFKSKYRLNKIEQ
jgi:hypothetical protein